MLGSTTCPSSLWRRPQETSASPGTPTVVLGQMFAKTVLAMDGAAVADTLEKAKALKGVTSDIDLDSEDLQQLLAQFKALIVAHSAGREFPQDPREQLDMATRAVFDSWNSPRARLYLRRERIPDDLGTAVNVCAMVFGNLGDNSGTGVCFTRDPATGRHGTYGGSPGKRAGRRRRGGNTQPTFAGRVFKGRPGLGRRP